VKNKHREREPDHFQRARIVIIKGVPRTLVKFIRRVFSFGAEIVDFVMGRVFGGEETLHFLHVVTINTLESREWKYQTER
jgi:hypothetical protein